ncbi:MAG: hypothetical protein M3R35_08605 [Candidatus Eremiobacteraeota bacterium]|nr:hypothetical protein [Candidatus Eremiobacteraeota bacterium]
MLADVPAVVRRAAELAVRDRQGIVAYRIHRSSELRAGPYHRADDVDIAAAFDGRTLVKIRVLRDVTNGRAANDAAKTQLEGELQRGQSAAAFAVPFDSRHFGEYRYSIVDARDVTFASLRHDAQHGDGALVFDPSGAVSKMVYSPQVLPRFATSAVITARRAQVLPGFWATIREEERYDGRYAFFRGSGTVTTVEDHFERFNSTAAAISAVEKADLRE